MTISGTRSKCRWDISRKKRGNKRSSNIDKEINVFRQNYLEFIKKNSYKDYNYLYVNGIDISKVDIYISGSKLYKLLTLYEELIRFVK